jgi:colanic acid/amylovoran biosynthesis protein
MTIDLRGANTNNKGAELMLIAAATRLGARAAVSATPAGTAYAARARLGLLQTLHIHQSPVAFSRAGNLVPARLRRTYGLVSDAELRGIVDISGFAYADQFAPTRAQREARRARSWDRRGVPRVFLPQAFGPFTSAPLREASRTLLRGAQLVFCRDDASLGYVRALDPSIQAVRAPDFTIGLQAAPTTAHALPGEFAALVPNTKMITSGTVPERIYRESLVAAGAAARAAGLEVVVVRHESTDDAFCASLDRELGCMVVRDPDPLVTKGVLGAASLVVGSRFHGIVSALAQGVPSVVMGWSHKYEGLLGDFAVPQWLVDRPEELASAVPRVLDDAAGRLRLRERTQALGEEVDAMWSATYEALRI